MKPFVILYATREGQTRRIAEHAAARIRERGHSAKLQNVREIREPLDLERYDGALLAASVHMGKHEPEMVELVKRHRDRLEELMAAFVSVSLQEAGAEDRSLPDDERGRASGTAQRMIDDFLVETGWRPSHVKAVAGALRYSRYNFLVRFVMKRIARKTSLPTDASRDYEYTDWQALDRFVDEMVDEAAGRAATHGALAPA